jgi:hypothetical protein
MRAAPALLALCAACAIAAHAGPMYKWVDEKGVTHFSDDPPPGGKAQKMDVKPSPSSSEPSAPLRVEDVRKRALELRDERLAREKRDEDAKRKADQDRSRCVSAQNRIESLRLQRRRYSMNERGERVYMEDKDRDAEMEKAQQAVEKYCGR